MLAVFYLAFRCSEWECTVVEMDSTKKKNKCLGYAAELCSGSRCCGQNLLANRNVFDAKFGKGAYGVSCWIYCFVVNSAALLCL